MKLNYSLPNLSALVTGLILAACSATSEEGKTKVEQTKSLQEQITKLKVERTTISAKIDTLQAKLVRVTGETEVKRKEVSATPVQLRQFDHSVQSQGAIESLENIQLSAKTPGIVTQV